MCGRYKGDSRGAEYKSNTIALQKCICESFDGQHGILATKNRESQLEDWRLVGDLASRCGSSRARHAEKAHAETKSHLKYRYDFSGQVSVPE